MYSFHIQITIFKVYFIQATPEIHEANQIVTNTNPSVRCVNILKDENGKRIYFAGTSIGLFSTDTLVLAQSLPSNKTVWKQESPNQIGASVVTDIRIRQQDGYLAIGTHGNGIFDNYYTGKTKPIANIEASSNSVYPNPASNFIWYSFSAQKDAETKIRIHNMQGQIVKQVQHNSFREGNFSLQIDVSNLPTGHYLISQKRKDDKRSSDTKHFIILR
jgi:flagellar hook assembly protein FlgD